MPNVKLYAVGPGYRKRLNTGMLIPEEMMVWADYPPRARSHRTVAFLPFRAEDAFFHDGAAAPYRCAVAMRTHCETVI